MRNSAVIVGGGPGGAAAAIALAQRGVDNIVLVDKEGFPRDKTCGSGLSPNALLVIDKLGIGEQVRSMGYPINSMRAVTKGGREIKLTTDHGAIVCLRRHFDNALIERAKSLGVVVKTPFTAKELVRENGRVVGVRSGDEEIRADYTLVVDGANSVFSFDPRPKQKIQTLMGWCLGARRGVRRRGGAYDAQRDGRRHLSGDAVGRVRGRRGRGYPQRHRGRRGRDAPLPVALPQRIHGELCDGPRGARDGRDAGVGWARGSLQQSADAEGRHDGHRLGARRLCAQRHDGQGRVGGDQWRWPARAVERGLDLGSTRKNT